MVTDTSAFFQIDRKKRKRTYTYDFFFFNMVFRGQSPGMPYKQTNATWMLKKAIGRDLPSLELSLPSTNFKVSITKDYFFY